MQLSDLGERICILGPSNSGKSTLAVAISRQRGLTPIHLDQLQHFPGSDWRPRPPEQFQALHEAAISGDRWVMDGNYSRCLPRRLLRATGLILLDISTSASLLRYFRRTLFERERAGNLTGDQDSIKWTMIHHILFLSPGSRRRYTALYQTIELPKLRLSSRREIEDMYRLWNLER